MLGTDTFRHSAAREIVCPFTGERLVALPALFPDVAAIHVHEADRFGNCRIRGTSVADLDVARAARRLIVTCERLIPNDEIRRDPTATVIPFFCVDAVCEVPFGSYPGNMPYEYFSDEEHLCAWLQAERDLKEYHAFLERYLFGVRDFDDYLQRCGGLPRLQKLRHEELLLNRGR
jgi:glutaconate CoA-transferase subunit A